MDCDMDCDELCILREVLEGVRCTLVDGCVRVEVPVLPAIELLQADLVFYLTHTCLEEHTAPEIRLEHVRGITDAEASDIVAQLEAEAKGMEGTEMLFPLCYSAAELLRAFEVPSEPCPVCMEQFAAVDDVFRTPCYHFLHKWCFSYWHVVRVDGEEERVAQAPAHKPVERNADPTWCPVCRLTVPTAAVQGLEEQIRKDDVVHRRRKVEQARTDRREEAERMRQQQMATGEVAVLFTALGSPAEAEADSRGASVTTTERAKETSDNSNITDPPLPREKATASTAKGKVGGSSGKAKTEHSTRGKGNGGRATARGRGKGSSLKQPRKATKRGGCKPPS